MKQKSIPIIILIIVLSLIILVTYRNKEKNTEKIRDIQEKVESINSEKKYQIKTLNNEQIQGEQLTDGGAQLIGYFKDGNISKIQEHLGLSYGVKNYEYYFLDEELILVNEREEYFLDPENTGTLDYTKLEVAFEGQYYFEKGKLIDVETTGTKRFPRGDNIDMENFFLNIVEENIELLKKE